jgi:hypothetical protein
MKKLKQYEVRLYYTTSGVGTYTAASEEEAVGMARGCPEMEKELHRSLEDNGYDVEEVVPMAQTDTMTVEVDKHDPAFQNLGAWERGTVGNFTFEAKVFDTPSRFGIENGTVSKLALYRPGNKRPVAEYDRGWNNDEEPSDPKIMAAVDAIVRHFQAPAKAK